MTKRLLRIAASVLILVSLALIVNGLANELPLVWGLGLVAAGTAMIMSLATRWAGSGPD